MARAKYHLLLNEPLTGADAERIGLVAKSVPAGEAVPTARALARRLARGSKTAIGWTKHALNGWWRMAMPIFDASLALEFLGFSGPDLREGIRAFREKREPSFEE
jgi:enoyl-CoA hydratase